MKILLLNTYSHGGAGTACRRLQSALNGSGNRADLLCAADVPGKWPFYAERLSFLPFERDKSVRFSFSIANFGHDLSNHPLVRQADVLHLHWVNQGFLSLQNISQLAALNKPMVWTLHDMWAFTGGCHYSGDCRAYVHSCGNCPYLRRPGPVDLSNRIWRRKQAQLPASIQIITCSEWLAGEARKSSLLGSFRIQSIPNPIDTTVFAPKPWEKREEWRAQLGISPGQFTLLFVAMKVSEKRKGFSYLLESLQIIKENHPDFPLKILVMGKAEQEDLALLPYPVVALGMLREPEDIVRAYNSADAFIIPSLEDNLPNTVMESLACGTPVVGFNTGGIPEMCTHLKEGYIAQQGDSRGLADGIRWVAESNPAELKTAARQKAIDHYAEPVIAARYLDVYRSVH